jgi:uncharacterized protein YukE
MAVWGLDVDQVRQLSTQLKQQADQVQQILSSLTNTLNSTQWTGPDSERFRNEWSTTHTNSLRQVISSMQDAGQRAMQNANEQESAAR